MSLKEIVAAFVIKRRAKPMFEKLKGITEGKKTYITAALGIIVVLSGALMGPIDIGTVHIPAFTWNEFFKYAWETALAVFIRKGIASK